MSSQIPSGVFTVLVTPFNNDETIDYISLRAWFDVQSKSNVAGFVLMGTTSESPTLSRDEQFEILSEISDWNKKLKDPKYIILGCGGNDTREIIAFSKKCINLCDAFMVTVPAYNKPTQNGIYEHFKTFCTDPYLCKIPVMIYNVPSRTGINMDVNTIKRVHENFSQVVAIKEASGSITQLIQLRSQVPTIQVFSGDDLLILDVMCHGGCGVISVASNVIPDIMCKVYDSCVEEYNNKNNKKYVDTYTNISPTKLFYELKLPELINALFYETNPIPIKYLLWNIGIFKNNVLRLPMTPLSKNLEEIVSKAFETTIELQIANIVKINDK
jgi:4-hydroxy-tetrahydrodipicolinate synthase